MEATVKQAVAAAVGYRFGLHVRMCGPLTEDAKELRLDNYLNGQGVKLTAQERKEVCEAAEKACGEYLAKRAAWFAERG